MEAQVGILEALAAWVGDLGLMVLSTGQSATSPTVKEERLSYVCNPRSLKEGMETSHRRTDELRSRLERAIHFDCKLNEPKHIGMQLLHPAAADHSVTISRQQVHGIYSGFC